MKTKKLLMVTSAFPFGQGEAFVKADLQHVSRHFGELEIVPCSYSDLAHPRNVAQRVNMAYADRRWGAMRAAAICSAFARALWRYRWRDDVSLVIKSPHRITNIMEFVRALYRAQLFEDFLRQEFNERKHEFDIIYFYWMVPEIMGAIQYRDRARGQLKVVARAHGGDLYEDRRGGYCGLRGAVVAGIDAIYCISDHGRTYLSDRYPFARTKMHTARLGVDDPGYLNRQPGEGALAIVSCSFAVPGKRLHLIVAAIAHLLAHNPALSIRWTHIGNGELFEQLRTSALQLPAARAQVVFKGYLTPDEIRDVYRHEQFDVFINVSDCEGVPVSLMEASAVGIPMVATDVGGSGEIVNAGNGMLIAADASVATIAAALIGFHDRPRAAAYRAQARRSWQQGFNAHSNYDTFGRGLLNMLEPATDAP